METLIDNEKILANVCNYIKIQQPELTSNTITEAIKEVCVARLCKSIGIRCKYNYKSSFFEFFSNVTGEAVCQNLGIQMHIAKDIFRLFKFENVNLVEKVKELLQNSDKDESFIDIFHFLDSCKHLVVNYA